MFTMIDVHNGKDAVSITVEYELANVVPKRIIKMEGTYRHVQQEYLESAFEFISFAFDELVIEVEKIKPHFFDKTAKPFFQGFGGWHRAYYNLMVHKLEMRHCIDTKNIILMRRVVQDLNLKALDPGCDLGNQKVLQELIKDIEKLSDECEKLFKLLTK